MRAPHGERCHSPDTRRPPPRRAAPAALAGVAVVLAVAWAGTAPGQDAPPTYYPFSRPPEQPPVQFQREPFRLDSALQATGWYGVATLALGAITVLSLVTRFYVRHSTVTDPEKLARSDPWVRARLAAGAADGDAGPPARQPPP
jgi:hypothetical protein